MTSWFRATASAVAMLFLAAPLAAACRAEEAFMSSEITSAGEPLSVEAVYGLWALQPVEGEGRCLIALSNMGEGPVRGVHIESCTIDAVAGGERWRPVEGGFELLGEEGRVMIRFRQTGVDGFESRDGRYRLTRAPMA